MSAGAWGVDANGRIRWVWQAPETPPVADGATTTVTVGGTDLTLTVRVPQSGERAAWQDFGKRFDGERPAAVIVPIAEQANDAAKKLFAEIEGWEAGLGIYGPDVYRVGSNYLASAWQAAKIVLADSTTYGDSLALTMFRNAALGALDITSPAVFADSAYALADTPAPTRALLWVSKTDGSRLALNAVADYGALVDERPFTPPTAYRSAA